MASFYFATTSSYAPLTQGKTQRQRIVVSSCSLPGEKTRKGSIQEGFVIDSHGQVRTGPNWDIWQNWYVIGLEPMSLQSFY